ncbi:hypothetical protein PR048_025631 [Dryococelus australis]|uniref:Reverse transcriptase domain-containing protein n=1 Tax=Dryococelus australis TaxID=614101 RepID=A0ABQ9GRT4_9NEOP|nr:hypothetical protein PR048_025631 [Dryococelus australis]
MKTLAEDLTLTFQTGQENINSNKDKAYTLTSFLDIEKAFDRVWHTGLLLKMTTQGYSDCYIELLQSYLTDRSLVVTLDGGKSETKPVTAGIPQGSKLSPLLYCIYTADIPTTDYMKTLMSGDTGHIKSIQTTQNKILRTAVAATRLTPTDELHHRVKTKKIITIIMDRNTDFYHKINNHENPTI